MTAIRLFTRGSESVRLVCEALPHGGMRLVAFGPGNAQSVYAFTAEVNCRFRQQELEQELCAQGFSLDRSTSERRRTDTGLAGEERRRP